MASPLEMVVGAAVEVVIVGIAGLVIYRLLGKTFNLPRRLKVPPFHKGLFLSGTQVTRIVDPGSYWVRQSQTLVQADMRPKPFQTPDKVLLAAGGEPLQISFSGEARIFDPARFVSSTSDAYGTLFVEVGKAIVTAVSEFDRNSIVNGAANVAARVQERVEPRASELGLQVVRLDVTQAVTLYASSAPAQR